jgi:pimeloyl-ACP methyl ester carboxylesterase
MTHRITTFLSFTIFSLILSTALTFTLANAKDNSTEPNVDFGSLKFERCLISKDAVQIDAQCATLERYENPEDRIKNNGKLIKLSVVKLSSHSSKTTADAFTIIQGGPGSSSIDLLISYSAILNEIRSKRDILVVDQRGTGRSNVLTCPEMQDAEEVVDPEKIKQLSQQCLDGLDANPRFYTTSIAVQDLDAVRHAAGYNQLSIYGVSYGTRVAQHYLRRFPDKSRAIILDGVTPIGLNLAGGEIARRSQASFDDMSARCKASDSCKKQFGDIPLKFKELRERLAEAPVTVSLLHPVSGELMDKELTEQDLYGVLRLMAYATESNALLPMLISKAHDKNYIPLAAQTLMVGSEFAKDLAIGMSNAVVCTEDAPFVEASDLEGLDNTYFGKDMANSIAAMCEVFPRGLMDDDFLKPFDTDVSVLILSGETDPITPPANGEQAAKMLSNSKHLIVPAHGHGVFSRGCVLQLSSQFIEEASFENLETDCIQREKPMPFFNNHAGPTS